MAAYYSEITSGAFYLYVILLLIAAVTDIWKFIIPNLLSLAVIALFVALALMQPFPVAWGSHLGAAALFFAGGLLLYRFNILGAGDVKLLTALSLWAGFSHLLDLLLGVALCGGGLALALIIGRKVFFSLVLLGSAPESRTIPRVLLQGEPVPYGVGIAAGGIWLGSKLPIFGFF